MDTRRIHTSWPRRAGFRREAPGVCRIDGMIDKRTGAAGATYGIGFAIALPQNWNGRFLLQGGGGLNGSVQTPLGASAAGTQSGLARGFAVASTDTGHEGKGGFDGSFQQDQQASLDFAYIAIGRVAEIAKRIVAEHYGKPAEHSYFAGCSTGCREAMLMAERYPAWFDGVIAGSPAMRTSYSGIGDRWDAAALKKLRRKRQGRARHGQCFFRERPKTVIEGLLNQCDALDGVKDRMIFNQKACHFEPKTLVCKGAKADGCLSAAQAAALEKGFAGPKDSKGRQVYPGFFFDTGIASTQGIPGLLRGGSSPVGPGFTDVGMNVDAAVERVLNDPAEPDFNNGAVDQSQCLLRPRRQAALLPRRQRSLVFRARHRRLLRAHDQSQRGRRQGARLEPPLPCSRHGPLRRRSGDARFIRRAERHGAVGGAGSRAGKPYRNRTLLPRP